MFGECHTPCMLKTSFVDFEKMCRHIVTTALQKTKFSVPTQLSILYQWQSKVDTTMTSLSIVYIYIIKLVLILNIIEILVNQSLKYGSGLKHIIYLENIWCLITCIKVVLFHEYYSVCFNTLVCWQIFFFIDKSLDEQCEHKSINTICPPN
jgi:hypothetical protein